VTYLYTYQPEKLRKSSDFKKWILVQINPVAGVPEKKRKNPVDKGLTPVAGGRIVNYNRNSTNLHLTRVCIVVVWEI
jgi:hypothetical protein